MKISYQDVLRAYPSAKAEEHKIIAPYSYYVLGSLSLRLTPPFINRGMTANQVTALSLCVVMAIQIVTVLGAWSSLSFVLAGFLIHLFYLLDNIDGHIARFCGTTSYFGELFDTLVTWVHLSLFPLSLGFALYLSHSESVYFGLAVPSWAWLFLGILRMYVYLFTVAVGRKTDAILMNKATYFQPQRNKGLLIAKWVVELEPVFFIAAVPARCVAAVFFFYALFWFLIFFHTFFYNLNRLSTAAIVESASKLHNE